MTIVQWIADAHPLTQLLICSFYIADFENVQQLVVVLCTRFKRDFLNEDWWNGFMMHVFMTTNDSTDMPYSKETLFIISLRWFDLHMWQCIDDVSETFSPCHCRGRHVKGDWIICIRPGNTDGDGVCSKDCLCGSLRCYIFWWLCQSYTNQSTPCNLVCIESAARLTFLTRASQLKNPIF